MPLQRHGNETGDREHENEHEGAHIAHREAQNSHSGRYEHRSEPGLTEFGHGEKAGENVAEGAREVDRLVAHG